MSPDGIDSILAAPDEPVVASARPLGPQAPPCLAIATLTHRGATIGGGTVRTVAITGGPDGPVPRGHDSLVRTPKTSLVELMSAEALPPEDGTYLLAQRPDSIINNLIGIVHGGVSSAGLELVGLRGDQPRPVRTAADGVDPGELPAALLRRRAIPLRRNGGASGPQLRDR